MKILRYTLLAASLGFMSCEDANHDVDLSEINSNSAGVSGEVSGTWTRNSVIKVSGDIVIPAGKRLVIEEGCTVEMDAEAKPEFIVLGNLYVKGTEESPVRITTVKELRTPDSWGQNWGGILCGQSAEEVLLEHAIIEYGGASTTQSSLSVKLGLYKAAAGENLPAIWFSNSNGKLVMKNSIIKNFFDDSTYFDGGQLIITGNKFYTTGKSGGEGVNIKSGTLADVSYNLFYSNNTNAMKLSNAGDRSPQAHVVAYNNTILNTGWRRPSIKGGSIWLEQTVHAEIYNTLFVNTRFGVKEDTKKPKDARSTIANNLYYGHNAEAVKGFTPNGKDQVGGVNDILDTKTPGANDPKFVNYPLNTDMYNAVFNPEWDFRLMPGSPAIGKGKTNITKNFPKGLVMDGITYESPAPSATIGAYGVK